MVNSIGFPYWSPPSLMWGGFSAFDPTPSYWFPPYNFFDFGLGVGRSFYGSLFTPFDYFFPGASYESDLLDAGARLGSWGSTLVDTDPWAFPFVWDRMMWQAYGWPLYPFWMPPPVFSPSVQPTPQPTVEPAAQPTAQPVAQPTAAQTPGIPLGAPLQDPTIKKAKGKLGEGEIYSVQGKYIFVDKQGQPFAIELKANGTLASKNSINGSVREGKLYPNPTP